MTLDYKYFLVYNFLAKYVSPSGVSFRLSNSLTPPSAPATRKWNDWKGWTLEELPIERMYQNYRKDRYNNRKQTVAVRVIPLRLIENKEIYVVQ